MTEYERGLKDGEARAAERNPVTQGIVEELSATLTAATARIAELESVIERLQTPAMVSERQGWEICAEQRDHLASAQAEVASLKELLRRVINWGECLSLRVSHDRGSINWRTIEEAKKALAATQEDK